MLRLDHLALLLESGRRGTHTRSIWSNSKPDSPLTNLRRHHDARTRPRFASRHACAINSAVRTSRQSSISR
jgi:hypothetical protein